ncbi:hypothetical protein CVU76_03415 [Candidatus Dojkabacteria bacterium HGW-Dojkabacteria-1]|uniref:Uncharacterized protein n=1 Tax=Candidatus Dojkabacteria bacterium HGW-Dojkabacteria-1 TaxID=2013761 RepID=A0A2N2F4H1_9BACT|nr:MAG: hypothetical protein CVU76_03415 [Candidatus Dojkabacteria bacterium HGW-Dojkabacteria-1]
MFIAHGPLSFILNEKIQKKEIEKLTPGEHIGIALFSLFFGILPDFDLLLLSMTKYPPFQHHQVFTHSILFWILLWLLFRFLIYLFKNITKGKYKKVLSDTFLSVLHKTFLIGTMSHLFGDILFSHSQILLPLQMEVTILGEIFSKNYFSGHFFTVSMTLEILIVIFFTYLLYKIFFKQIKLFEYFLFILAGFSTIILFLNMYISLNTYNKAIHFQDGIVVYDQDFDTIIDYQDSDTDNDGVNNIESIQRSKLAFDVREILEGKYLTSSGDSIWSRYIHLHGGLNSYRLISQAFFEQNRPIEPVLREFALREYNIREYDIPYSYSDLLYGYFKQNNLLKDFNVNVESGSIFFVVDDDTVVNMGIVLDNNMVGIVLEQDTRTRLHTLVSIKEEYSKYTILVER